MSLFRPNYTDCCLRITLLFVLLFLSGVNSVKAADEDVNLLMSDEMIERGLSHGHQILQKYPATDYFVFQLGPTTPLWSSLFRVIHQGSASSYYSEIQLIGLWALDNQSDQKTKWIFDTLLPTDDILQGRTIVLTRVLQNGNTMNSFVPLLMRYLARHRPNVKLTYYFVGSPHAKNTLDAPTFQKNPIFETGDLIVDKQYHHAMVTEEKRYRAGWPSSFSEVTKEYAPIVMDAEKINMRKRPKKKLKMFDEFLRRFITKSESKSLAGLQKLIDVDSACNRVSKRI